MNTERTTETGRSGITRAAWQAVLLRDRHHDGKFVYAASTTGIYCRPSCPARHPHRRNTIRFSTAADAERRGYVACRRCHPDTFAPAELSVGRALRYIETHLERSWTLRTLSQASGLSPNHLQQTFRRIVGLSPKVFGDMMRVDRFRELIKRGTSITGAAYEVGYGSSRALYERVGPALGMTPAIYQRGGEGVRIRYLNVASTLGRVLIADSGSGICAVFVGVDDKALIRQLRAEFPKATLARERSTPSRWQLALNSCQRQDPLLSKLPPDLRVKIFQGKIVLALRRRKRSTTT
ncbi:MAG TPA: Ada metal-binding domain-containing protein [Vicinamibacterales bacterium]|nr:Ada metal-binding domain-containing protein [Vicinamibacterales bacterium]